MSMAHAVSAWIRRTFGWVTSPQSWIEIFVVVALCAAAFGLWWFGAVLPALLQVILWGMLLLVTAILFRKGWLKLFGPVLFYDMVRSGRRGRFILIRVVYACLLFFFLFFIFQSHRNIYRRHYSDVISPQRAARLAQDYFEMFMATQLIAVFLLTPAYVAGAIADEKNRRTLEFLLATDLRSREIILSKLGARLAQMTMFVLTGLPILSFMQFLGGVSPNLIIAGFVTTAMTMFGLAGISIFQSTYYKRPRDAIAITYLMVLAYVIISLLLWAFQRGVLRAGIPGLPVFLVSLLDNGIETFNSGNLLILLPKVKDAGQMGTLSTELPVLVGNYSAFYGIFAIGGTLWAMLRLRPIALKQSGESRRKRACPIIVGWRRPAVSEQPMLWKELHVEGGLRFNWIGKGIVLLLVAASFVWPLIVYYFSTTTWNGYGYGPNSWRWVSENMNGWARAMSCILGCVLLLAIAVRASNSISGERDRQTFDSLLTTPMSSNQILAAKWLGSIASVRWGWLWLGVVFFLCLITGGLHPLALPLVCCSLIVYAAFVSMLGCWFSVVSKSSMRATIFTLLATVFCAVGFWLPWMCCIPIMVTGPGRGEGLRYLMEFQAGLTPPVVLAVQPFYWNDFMELSRPDSSLRNILVFSVVGFGFWTFATAYVWAVTSSRFRKITHRESDILPDFEEHPPEQPRPRSHLEDEVSTNIYPLRDPLAPPPQVKGAVLLEESFEPPRKRKK